MKKNLDNIKVIEADIKQRELSESQIEAFISKLYQNRLLEVEQENQALLDALILATQGKGIILQNISRDKRLKNIPLPTEEL